MYYTVHHQGTTVDFNSSSEDKEFFTCSFVVHVTSKIFVLKHNAGFVINFEHIHYLLPSI